MECVWLRINHCESSQGRRARLRVGVLYHVGNRTLTFHGSASAVRQLLLPLFQDWTFATLASLPSVSQVGEPQPPPAPAPPAPSPPLPPSVPCTTPPVCQETPVLVPPPPLHSRTPPALALLTGAKVVRSSSLSFVGSPSNSRLCKVRSIARLVPLPLHPSHTLRRLHPHPVFPPRLGLTHWRAVLAVSLHLLSLSHRLHFPLLTGCVPVVAAASPVPPLCSTGYCDSHCHSRRCSHHHSAPQPTLPVGSSRPLRPPHTCR